MEYNEEQRKIATDYSEQNSFVLYTYATDSILDYSSYSIAINSIYAASHGYSFKFTSPNTGHQFYANDERWNKVRILMTAMESHDIKAATTSTVKLSERQETVERNIKNTYLIFLDADLIFLDFNMDLDLIVKEYSWADMIFSKDSEPKNGIINSGFIIVKSCEWSYLFLKKWWGTSDIREMATDQHAFSTLWIQDMKELEKHIALLEPDAINSNFPAWKNQKSHNPILHLAGGSSVFRTIVFRTGFENVCKAFYRKLSAMNKDDFLDAKHYTTIEVSKIIRLNAGDLPPQLGLDVAFISNVERNLPLRVMIAELVTDITGDFCSACDISYPTKLEMIEEFRKKIRNIFQRGQGATMSAFQREELMGIVAAVRLVFLKLIEEIESLAISSSVSKHQNWARFELLQDVISSGFDVVSLWFPAPTNHPTRHPCDIPTPIY